MKQVKIGESALFADSSLGLIAGPCVIESREHCLRLAEQIAGIVARHDVGWVFKASYDKANRTAAGSFRGPGPEEGLRILEDVRTAIGVRSSSSSGK